MEKRWAFRHLSEEVRVLTRGAASALDRASAERPEVALRVARQLFERLRSDSERRSTLLAMVDLPSFDARRSSTAELQQNVLDRITRKRDLLLVHDTEDEARCCPSARLEFRADLQASATAQALEAQASSLRAAPEREAAVVLATPSPVAPARLASQQHAGVPARRGGDSASWSLGLQSLHRGLRPKVAAVLAGLSRRGFHPRVHFAWRSVAVQLQLFAQGRTNVKFSFHNAQLADGTPNAYAADIVDARYGWSNQAKLTGFWRALGEEAHAQNLYWGGDWKAFRDWAHVQLVDNAMLPRVKKESGL